MAGDITKLPLRCKEIFDAIVTDPPYGIREGGRKLTSRKDISANECSETQEQYFPAKSKHELSDVILDLIEFAAKYLVLGGRLVYWLPVYTPTYSADLVPQHHCFKIVANSEQILTSKVSRRLITMEKILTYKDEDHSSSVSTQAPENWKSRHNEFRANYFKGEQESKMDSSMT